jgi:hypothetical protein
MKHQGGNVIVWFMLSGYPGLHTWLSTQDLCGCRCLGFCFSELLVQPYDNMGSFLIEYDVRVHPWVLTEGGICARSDLDG